MGKLEEAQLIDLLPFYHELQTEWESRGNTGVSPILEAHAWQTFPQLMTERSIEVMIGEAKDTIAKKARMELPPQEYFSPKELANIFGVSDQAIRNLDGKLSPPLVPHRTDGGHRRYTQKQAQQIRVYFAS